MSVTLGKIGEEGKQDGERRLWDTMLKTSCRWEEGTGGCS